MSFSDVSGSLSGVGETAVLEDVVETGVQYAIRVRTVLTSDEFDAAQSSGGMFGGGGGGGARSSAGAWWSGTSGLVFGSIASLIGAIAIKFRGLGN